MPDEFGLVGFFVFLAGVNLLWLSREEVFAWLEKYFRTFRQEYARRGGLPADGPAGEAESGRTGLNTLRLAGGFLLLMLGPLLVILALAF